MAEIELALAASARAWSDGLHAFLTNHGGARVRTVVMSSEDATTESYDLLVIDDVCSFLTPRLVGEVERLGRLVVGVFDSKDGADAKRRLLDCGIHNMVDAGASPEEFLEVIANMSRVAPNRVDRPKVGSRLEPAGRVVVVGAPAGGCGATEIALAMAVQSGAVLVDADDIVPAVAQRVAAPLHPNLRTAIDVVHHQSGDLADVVTSGAGARVITGLVGTDDWTQVYPGEVEAVVTELAVSEPNVIVNVSSGLERPHMGEGRFGLARGMVLLANEIVAVGLSHPVSVTRLVRWAHEANILNPSARIHLVINRMPRSSYRRAEIAAELDRVLGGIELAFVPEDPRVTEAAWEGSRVGRGPFSKAVSRMTTRVMS